MRFRIQNILIQTNHPRLRENQIKIFECLCQPETLHFIFLHRIREADVVDAGVRNIGASHLLDAAEHAPCGFLVFLVACDTVEDIDGFDGFGAGCF